MSKKVLIKCNEATSICDKNQYGNASTCDKLKLKLHNFLCHRCNLYSEQNKMMSKIFKIHLTKQQLGAENKKDLQKVLDKELKNLDLINK